MAFDPGVSGVITINATECGETGVAPWAPWRVSEHRLSLKGG